MNEQQRIGEIIKKARESAALSQGKLATLLGVQNPVIYKYENGKIKVIPFEKRVKLAEILNIPLSDLLYSDEFTTKMAEALGINSIIKEFELFDALGVEIETELENADTAKKIEAVKAKIEIYENKRLELEKGVARCKALVNELTKKTEELKKLN